MKNDEIKILRAEIQSDLDDLETVVGEITEIAEEIQSSDGKPTRRDMAALGSFVHSFYNGIENILKRVSREIDGSVPRGESWHRALLKRAGQEIPEQRPPILRESTVENLKPYMGFRHFFRHSYAFEIDWEKLKPLVKKAGPVLAGFREDIESFFSEYLS